MQKGIKHIASTERDITAQKRTVEVLRESEDCFRQLAESLPQLVWTCRMDGLCDYLSPQWVKYTGIPESKQLGMGWLNQLHPEDLERTIAVWNAAIGAGSFFDIEFRIRRSDGVYRWFSTRAVPLRDNKGQVAKWFGSNTDIDDRKRSEEALQDSLQRFELLTGVAGNLLLTPDPQEFVEALCRRIMDHLDCHAFFNFLVDEKAGRLHLNACAGIPDEEARRIEWLDYGVAVCGCVARDGCRIVAENIGTMPDPRTELVKSYGIRAYACHPLQGADGKVIGTLSFGTRTRDRFSDDDLAMMKAVADQVTSAMIRAKAHEALRASEKKYRQLMETLQEGVWAIDQDSNTSFVNPHMAAMLGYSVEEMLGKPLFNFMDESGVEIAKRNVELRKQGLTEQHDFEFVRKDGNRVYTILDTAPLTDEKGNYSGALAGVIDITERKREEEAIKWLAKFPSENPNPVLRIARDGKLLYVNPAGMKQLPEWRLQVGRPAPPWMREVAAQVLAEGATQTIDIAHGARMYSFFVAQIVDGPYANLYGLDITDIRSAQKELRRQRQEIFHMERVQTMGELAASLAHEINQPLMGIMSNAQAAQRFMAGSAPDLDEIRYILADIVADDKRAGEVIQRLRASLMKQDSVPKHMDLNDAIHEIIKVIHSEAVIKDVSIATELARDLPSVLADRVQFQQVVLNLIRNAEQAMAGVPAGERRIVIQTHHDMSQGVTVSVRDTGVGIAKQQFDTLFKPFYTTKPDGLGMGLNICRSIVEEHGGRIWLENNPDRGARACFTLPAAEANAEVGTRSSEENAERGARNAEEKTEGNAEGGRDGGRRKGSAE